MEVWEKVLVSEAFVGSEPHGGRCVSCHHGDDAASVKAVAHTGMIPDPSAGDAPACRECHADEVENHAASLHATQNGYHTMFDLRGAGPAGQVDAMFEARCASCHTTCGQCHISRPNSIGGGMVNGHQVLRRPSQQDNCTACHGSRVGNEFRGENKLGDTPIPADAHYLKLMNCGHCHDGAELHGDGATPDSRYHAPGAANCLDCHPEVESDSNLWHSFHARATSEEQLSCQVCHAQSYKNCYGCHVQVDSQGLRHPSRIDFRIGRNPAPDAAHPWDWVVLRHIPIAEDTYAPWGITMSSYAALPTWRMATPHNIRKHTSHAYPSSGACSSACHDHEELFLTEAYIQTLIEQGVMSTSEIEANQGVIATLR